LINTEHNAAWIQCNSKASYNLKPDLFTAHHHLIHFEAAYENAPKCTAARLFGKFSNWECRASIHCIWKAKWKINMSTFGEICKYLQIAGEDFTDYNGVALKLKGVLFDVEEFWMIRSSGNTIVDVMRCPWSQKGSMNQLENFLHVVDPWLDAADALCRELEVTIVDLTATTQGQSALLGAGAHGRVFMLTNGRSIKIVVGKNSHKVEKEYKLMIQCLERVDVNPFVFPIVKDSFRSGVAVGVHYAGYLLEGKGEKITLPVSPEVMTELVALLYALHSKDIIHGDPRIDNVLRLGSDLKWIYFRDYEMVTIKVNKRHDVKIFLKSVGCILSDVEIDKYVEHTTLNNLTALIKKI
jgi:DNA-binding Xre family transcriptional regulator